MMKKVDSSVPIVLALSAHDPSGGAGVQADIETIRAHGCVALSVITAITEQSLQQGMQKVIPQKPGDFQTQLDRLLNEFDISAIKIGAIGSLEIAECISAILPDLASIPIVLDPVLAASRGKSFTDNDILKLIRNEILQYCTIITPNLAEVTVLSSTDTIEAAIQKLHNKGCDNILLTSARIDDQQIHHHLYQANLTDTNFSCKKLAGEFHGSGCTLSAAIATNLAQSQPLAQAIEQAIQYTLNTLEQSLVHTPNLAIPNRFPDA